MRKPCILLARPLLSPAFFPRRGLLSEKANPPCLHGRSSRAFYLTKFKSILPTMASTRFLYEPIDDMERMEYSQGGGYHPVVIGDRFNDRFIGSFISSAMVHTRRFGWPKIRDPTHTSQSKSVRQIQNHTRLTSYLNSRSLIYYQI